MTKDQLSKIREFSQRSMKKTLDPQHDFEHVERVRKNAIKIAKIVEVERKIDLNLLQAACLLHDLTYTKHKPSLVVYLFEGKYLEKIGPQILGEFEITKEDKKMASEAFLHHTHWFPLKGLLNVKNNGSIYTKILQDADAIDLFTGERWESLVRSRKKYLFYKLSWPITVFVIEYGRKNAEKFLNFPQIASHFLS